MENVTARIRKTGDGEYVVVQIVDGAEVISDVCKIVDDGKTIALPANDSNRKYFNLAKFEEAKNEADEMLLTYKATVTLGDRPKSLPNGNLIAYLSDELQEEYKAIIDRAVEARAEQKAKPLTDLEKAQAKVKSAQAALIKLVEQAEGSNDTEEVEA